MENSVKSVEYQLYENLVRMQEMISLLGFDGELKARIVACKELLKTRKYTVAVMGEFKRGKSSLINALLGSKVLPADVTPTTATINRITYGTEPAVQIQFLNGTTEKIGINQLPDYVSKLTPEGANIARQIREAVVYYPTVICQNYVDIIDTPGLDDDDAMTRITIDMIQYADAVIIPILARSPFSETENRFVCDLMERGNIGNLIFVVTFMDHLDEDDYKYDTFMQFVRNRILHDVFEELERRGCLPAIQQKAHRLLDGIEVHGISSMLALESFLTNNRKLRERSHFEPFYQDLLRRITSDQVVHTANMVHLELTNIVDQFKVQNTMRIKQWEQERSRINLSKDMYSALGGILRKDLNSKFITFDGMVQNTMERVKAYKPTILRGFIASLSSIRENTHQAIFTALLAEQDRIYTQIADTFQEERKRITRSLFELLSFDHTCSNSSTETVSATSLKEELLSRLEQSMRESAEAELSKLTFRWARSPIPQTQDLSRCNVIENITAAVDASITELNKRIDNAVIEVRKNWFLQARTFADEINATAQESLRQADELLDMRYKAYLNNYFELSAQSGAIIEQSEQLYRAMIDLTTTVHSNEQV